MGMNPDIIRGSHVDEIAHNIRLRYLQDKRGCELHLTTPKTLYNLVKIYRQIIPDIVHHFFLNNVSLTFEIENNLGGCIDGRSDMYLTWIDVPKGIVSISLGSFDENHDDPLFLRKYLVAHELSHVLVFAYLKSEMNYPTYWDGWLHKLPKTCPISPSYIELMCDFLAMTYLGENRELMLTEFQNFDHNSGERMKGGAHYRQNFKFAYHFIKDHSQSIAKQIQNQEDMNNTWKSVLTRYFNSEKARIMQKITQDAFAYTPGKLNFDI